MLTLTNHIPTPHSADELLEWLHDEVRIDDITIINEALDFIAKNYDAEFRYYITKEYLADE